MKRLAALETATDRRLVNVENLINDLLDRARSPNDSNPVNGRAEQTVEALPPPNPFEDEHIPDEVQGTIDTDPESSTASPEPARCGTTIATPRSDFPRGEALADRMMRYFHYARRHDLVAYESYSQQLRDELSNHVEGA